MVMHRLIYTLFMLATVTASGICQAPQGFFLNSWAPRETTAPQYTDAQQATDPVTLAITIDYHDTITKIPQYLFGDNANLWTGCMADNKGLMKNIANRNMGLMRGPGGSISDVFFWNRNVDQRPADVPTTLQGSSETNWPWYGDRPYPWETWTMDVDSFYSILAKVGATGMITVNYGYARYGTGVNPVAQAAHMAADWVRYDKGRSKFWEIGNEVFGSWEAGYRIDPLLNKDGQPEYITPDLYGQHCRIFIDSMRAAAVETGATIYIGVVMVESSSTHATWNKTVAQRVGDMADFYVVHSYYTPYNQNSDVATVLNSYSNTAGYKNYVWEQVALAGKPLLPVALTEYNIFAINSNQPVSHANGMHAVLVTGELIRSGYGAACRWDLANGWDNGNDHGMYAFNEPGVTNYTPHPAFFHLYYMRKFTGDVLLNSSMTGAAGVVAIPTAFHSGHIGAALVNTSKVQKIIRVNLKNYKVGDRYYTYTLTGASGEDFSRKVYINGTGPELPAGGPADYESVKAVSSAIGTEIVIRVPALSSVFILVEPGSRELAINNTVTAAGEIYAGDDVTLYPNPAGESFIIRGLPAETYKLEIIDARGAVVMSREIADAGGEVRVDSSLLPGIYFVSIRYGKYSMVKKLVIK